MTAIDICIYQKAQASKQTEAELGQAQARWDGSLCKGLNPIPKQGRQGIYVPTLLAIKINFRHEAIIEEASSILKILLHAKN